uniref:Uncharacterized protein n=1 Tax=Praha toti-like virus TaxID=2789620 RepID=A0A7T1GW28_9VIRU|nr:hypothetical protein [Praha toti-like virus]
MNITIQERKVRTKEDVVSELYAFSKEKANSISLLDTVEYFKKDVITTSVAPQRFDVRRRLLPGEADTVLGFLDNHSVTANHKNKLMRSLTLSVNHGIRWAEPKVNGIMGKVFEATSYLIFEDVFHQSLLNNGKLDNSKLIPNLNMKLLPIAQHLEQHQVLRNSLVVPHKKEFDSLKCPSDFDFRLLCYVIGIHVAIYFSRGETYLDTNDAICLRVNTAPYDFLGSGDLFLSEGLAQSDYEIGSLLCILRPCGVKQLIMLNESTSLTTRALKGGALIVYLLKLYRNIIFTANSLNVGLDHYWAFLCGLHRVIKIHAHSDEGGFMRDVLCMPVYPPVCGLLYETSTDLTGYGWDGNLIANFQRHSIIDMLLQFPVAVFYSDAGCKINGHEMMSIFSQMPGGVNNMASYPNLIGSVQQVLNNMKGIIESIVGLAGSNQHQSLSYNLNKMSADLNRHLSEPLIVPYVWVDINVCNIFGLRTPLQDQLTDFHKEIRSPLFPEGTELRPTLGHHDFLGYCEKGSSVIVDIKKGSLHNSLFEYVYNRRYNSEDGLACFYYLNENGQLDQEYVNDNIMMGLGSLSLADNRWLLPHSSFMHPYENYNLSGKNKLLFHTREKGMMPSLELLTCSSSDVLHKMSRFHVSVGTTNFVKFMPRSVPKRLRSEQQKVMNKDFTFEIDTFRPVFIRPTIEDRVQTEPITVNYVASQGKKINEHGKLSSDISHGAEKSLNELMMVTDLSKDSHNLTSSAQNLLSDSIAEPGMEEVVWRLADFSAGDTEFSLIRSKSKELDEEVLSNIQNFISCSTQKDDELPYKRTSSNEDIEAVREETIDIVQKDVALYDLLRNKLRKGSIPTGYIALDGQEIDKEERAFIQAAERYISKKGYQIMPECSFTFLSNRNSSGRQRSYVYRVPVLAPEKDGYGGVRIGHISGNMSKLTFETARLDSSRKCLV